MVAMKIKDASHIHVWQVLLFYVLQANVKQKAAIILCIECTIINSFMKNNKTKIIDSYPCLRKLKHTEILKLTGDYAFTRANYATSMIVYRQQNGG